uniref:AIDA repeat-containing protein n=1 Tax=Escherichia coli TaxID=562 RepID=UPI0021C02988
TVEAGGTAENTTIKAGGQQDVSGTDTSAIIDGGQQTVKAGGKATGTTINKDGRQYVETGGTAEDTIINEDGLMQNAGEDSGTTVKDGGVYELGRYSYGSPDNPAYRYYGTAGASGLTVEAGGRAAVYAGTLTGATVSGKNTTLTLMTPKIGPGGYDLPLALKGKVSVTDHASLVSQREADLSLSSQGTLILKGDAGCPEEGCSWTVNSLAPDNGVVAFYDTAVTPVSDGGYQTLTTGS